MFTPTQIAQARAISLLRLVEPDTTLVRIASTRGGEYAGPCPFCGGTDRFHVQPVTGKWFCRTCTPRGGDTIDYVGSLGFCGKGPHIGLPRLRKPAITFQVQIQTLEERGDATNAVAAPLEGLDLVVEALHETAAAPLREVVDNLSQPVG